MPSEPGLETLALRDLANTLPATPANWTPAQHDQFTTQSDAAMREQARVETTQLLSVGGGGGLGAHRAHTLPRNSSRRGVAALRLFRGTTCAY